MEQKEIEREGGSKTILVIEDNEDQNELIRITLDDSGYKTVPAHCGEEGLRLMKEIHPDLVLLDFVLPDIDGKEMFNRISLDETIQGIPIIVVSGRSDLSTKLSSYTAGARRYVTKPFDVGDLLNEIERTLLQLERTKEVKKFRDTYGGDGDFGSIP